MALDLTTRQQQVLDLWLSGRTYRQVAEECGISGETVNPHLKKIARKLGIKQISREALAGAVASQPREPLSAP